jgi:hypothetical protein
MLRAKRCIGPHEPNFRSRLIGSSRTADWESTTRVLECWEGNVISPTVVVIGAMSAGRSLVTALQSWSSEWANRHDRLPCPAFERAIIQHVSGSKQLLQQIGVTPPFAIMVTMVGMKGWRIATNRDSSAAVFDRDPVFIPELVLEVFGGIVQDESKPLLDAIWNAAGSPGSPNYDDQGRRKADDT